MIETVAFILCCLVLILISRKTIHSLRSHGLYRLISWISLTGLFLLNWRYWFRDAFSILQIISWISLVISILLLVEGLMGLHKQGKPNDSRVDESLLGLEKTTQLVNGGIYQYIRHPMYSSLLFLGVGIFLKAPSLWSGGLLVLAIVFLHLTALVEEQENIRYFGNGYIGYMARTKRFIPYIW